MLDLKTLDRDSLLRCIADCGKIDRLMYKFEKNYTPDKTVLEFNAGFADGLEPGGRSVLIAKGAFDWLRDFHNDPGSFSLSNTSVKAMHRKIFKYSPRDDGTRGYYRTESEDDMKQLFDDMKYSLSSDVRHPLFSISLFRSSFLEKMPFVTGNLLSANLLSYALLNSNGYPVVSQLPLLASLNNGNSVTATDSIAFLPEIMLNELTAFLLHPIASNATVIYINPRQNNLLEIIRLNAPLKISDIMNKFPNESRNTIKKDLLYLRKNELVITRGEGRGMIYVMGNGE